ncbi:MAG TPA: MFS transporter [Chloroflexota bacterium]
MSTAAAEVQEAATFDRQSVAILALVSVAQLILVTGATIVNVALPSIETALHFSRVDLQWVINAYTLIFAGFLLLGGRAADLLGRRSVLMAGLSLFTGASLICGLAQSSIVLEVARGVQGLGAAIISPAALSILLVTFREGAARNRALAVWGGVAGGGQALGLILGGLLTQGPGWRWVFFVNVPIGILAVLAAPRILPESHGEDRSRSYDLPGAITVTLALVLLVYAIVGTTTYGRGATRTIGELIGAALLLAVFVAIEGRIAAHPLVPLRIFRSQTLSGANVVMLLLGLALFAAYYFLSLYMQQVQGFSPLRTGLGFLPISVGFVVVASVAARLVGRVGAKWLLVIGMSITAAAFLLLAQLPDQGTYARDILPAFIVLPLGAALAILSVTNAAVAGVTPRDAGLASALVNTSQLTGGAVGLGLLATIAASRTSSVLATDPRAGLAHALVQGFHSAFFVAAGIAAAGAIVALLTIPAAIGRVTRARRLTPLISHPAEESTPPAEHGTARPLGGLAACALCDPVSRHPVVSASGGHVGQVARPIESSIHGQSAHSQ